MPTWSPAGVAVAAAAAVGVAVGRRVAVGVCVIVVAAFGGGLAGAILQPLMSYALDRVRSKERIRKDRERSLRRMLFAEIRETRRLQAWARSIALGTELNRDLGTGPAPFGGPFWEPHRIKHDALRKVVEEYNRLKASLYTAGYEKDVDEIRRVDAQLNQLQVEITRIMDEQDWPEADQVDA